MNYRIQLQRVLSRVCRGDVKTGLTKGFQFIDERTVKGTYESLWRVPSGYSCLDVEKQIDALCAACGAIVEIVNKAGAVIIRVFPNDLPALIPFDVRMVRGLKKKELLLGYDRQLQPVIHSLENDNPHMIIAGETGWGKTELIRLMLYTIISQYSPEEAEIFIVDMKGFSFMPFRSVPIIQPIARRIETAVVLLERTVQEMQDRSDDVWDSGNRNTARHFKQRFIIIDEAAQLAPDTYRGKDDKEIAKACDSYLSAIARIGREAGIHLLYATQYPTGDVINRQVKINCGGRVCYRVYTQTNSEVVLDKPGAELISHKGRAIYKSTEFQTLQTPYLLPKKGEDKNDNAWNDLLIPFKTEVINSGSSTRKSQTSRPKIIIDGPGSDNAASRAAIPRERESNQASIRTITVTGARETNRGKQAPQHGKSVEVDEEGPRTDRDDFDHTFI